MELWLIVKVLLRWWWVVLIPVVIAAAISLPQLLNPASDANSGGFVTTFRYSAAQEFNLPQRDGDYQDVWLASEFVVNAFTDWIRSSTFRDEIAQQVESVNQAALGIFADNNRSIGVVQMTYPDAEVLDDIVQSAIIILQTRSQAYFPHLGGEPAQVTLIDAPVVTPSPPSLPNRFRPILQIAVALLGGVGLAFLVDYLDPTLRNRRDIELTGLPIIASIPRNES